MLKFKEYILESYASDRAKELGLQRIGRGVYGWLGKVTHITRKGQLHQIKESDNLFEEQQAGCISGKGINAERHKEKYLNPYLKSKTATHTTARKHGNIAAGANIRIHKVSNIEGVTHAHVSDENGNKEVVPVSKIIKPGVKTENAGHKFENAFIDHLKKHGLMDKDAQGAGSTAGTDFHVINKKKGIKHPGKLQHNGAEELNGETKQDHSAAMGQITIHHDKKRGWHVPDDARAKRPEYAKHVDRHIIPYMKKNYPNGPKDQRVTESGRAASDRIPHPDMEPAKAYLGDHHVDLLHVGGGKGSYSVGKDKTGHGLPEISGKGLWTVRDKAKSPNARTVMFQSHGVHGLNPSHVNLENEEHVKAFKKTLGHTR